MSKILMSKYYFEKDFSEFEDVIRTYNVIEKSYNKSDMVSSQYETLNNGYYINKGIMKLSIGSECGKEKTLALFGPGSIFPLGINEHHYELEYAITEQAFTDLEVLEFNFDELRKMFEENKDMALRMMEHYCDFTSFLFYEISILTSESSFTKTCNLLYSLSSASVFKKGVISMTQTDIAELGGMSRIQVARAYQELKSKGIIEINRNSVMVIDYEGLKQLCIVE